MTQSEPSVPPTLAPPRARIHVGEGTLKAGDRVSLTAPQAHHLTHVLRLRAGASIALFNGESGEWAALLEVGGKGKASAVIVAPRLPPTPTIGPWLLFAPIKRLRQDLLIEKATELGATRLIPVMSARSEPGRVNAERAQAIMAEAAQQSGRLDLPDLASPLSLNKALDGWPLERTLVICAEAGPVEPLAQALVRLRHQPAAFLIGPEGGFTADELAMLNGLAFARAVGLGPRVLRAETAALAALAAWQVVCGPSHPPPTGSWTPELTPP